LSIRPSILILKMKKILLLFAIIFTLTSSAFSQQDAQYSQYIFNGIYINPAYAGYKEVLNLHSYYRNQWNGIPGAPKTFSLAVDAIANEEKVGLALQVVSDKLGAQTNLSAYASYAYRLRLNEVGSSRLSFGISAGLLQLGIDGSLLNSGSTPEPQKPVGVQSTLVPDGRAGVFYANDRFFAGLSADNIIASTINVSKTLYVPQPVVHLYVTAGALFPFSERIFLKPSFLLKDDRKGPTSLDLNAFLIVNEKIWLGGSYRTAVKLYTKSNLASNLDNLNSATAMIQFFPIPALRIGYSYDFSLGPLQSISSGGAHEISIAYEFLRKRVRMSTPRVF
jgi:type IX secretion system PorP/SprF family membrane protein